MVWHAYYIVISIARFLLLRNYQRSSKCSKYSAQLNHEIKAYKMSGLLLIMMTLFLQATVIHMIFTGNGYVYQGFLIYVVALQDFICLTKAIFQIYRFRKENNLILKAIKTFSLSTSLVSLLSLQSAMFASFGSSLEIEIQQRMNFLTGNVICLILVFMGGYD